MRITILFLLLCSCSAINKEMGVEDEHIVEELAEVLIYAETGLNIDITPLSPEK